MSRQIPFSYHCSRCGRCCVDMRIQVNPYEACRLARRLGLTTTHFLARHTVSGVHLATRPDRVCGFLSSAGCAVHPDRPLVCRLYPLARHVTTSGRERFACLLPRPGSPGEFGATGSVEDYLAANEAGPFLAEADAWLALFGRVHSLFQALLADHSLLAALASDIRLELLQDRPPPASPLLDTDRFAGEHCAALGRVLPADPAEKSLIHREALEHWLHGLHPQREAFDESLARLVGALGVSLGVNVAALLQDAAETPPGASERDEALRLGAEFL